MGYREFPAPHHLRDLVECAWTRDPGGPARVLPDGCMDLIKMDGTVVVAGPDTFASVAEGRPEPLAGLRFRPGALPRLIGVPAAELRDGRTPLADVTSVPRAATLTELATVLAADRRTDETAPWPLSTLAHVTSRLAAGASVGDIADEIGRSTRSLQRQCAAIYGYGPAMLRRILRFRLAVAMLRSGMPYARVAAAAGYADQPHLHREARVLSGMSLGQLADGANRSTEVPSGSSTVA
ncbi:helix-turn-helix transcriptional regulator [Mycolicibacterium sp. S2-37]|uniref:helix-turn-helix domain-containing protein n=1 Tax=Mycolicibacterium sp. S2-37 TaxID=2810297 RepID=UPI001A94FB71|nr:helix-turn-helix domain-containing protein [Mycolicibacterium sp. S2-37]MBO0680934.1 helix-turn-helix transcriptional regulator [Mycolicibacterium sp. S2-37]